MFTVYKDDYTVVVGKAKTYDEACDILAEDLLENDPNHLYMQHFNLNYERTRNRLSLLIFLEEYMPFGYYIERE